MKKRVIFLIYIIVFFVPSFMKSGEVFAHIEKIFYLKGKINEKSVIVKIKCFDESPVRYMNYFFEDNKKDHYMEGNLFGDVWQFNSLGEQNGIRTFAIKEDSNGNWNGFWSEDTNKKTNIILKPLILNPDSRYISYIKSKQLDPYDTYKISILNLEKSITEKHHELIALDWYTERESNIRFFRLVSENKQIKLDSINRKLEFIQLSMIQNYFQYNPNRQSLIIQPQIELLNESLISFKLFSNTTLKNQNPITTQQSYVFDIQNGNQITLENIIWFGDKNAILDDNDISQTYEYRKKVFAPKVFRILNELYPQQMKMNECNLNVESTWTIPSFVLTNRGIQFSFSTSVTCNMMEWAIIPYFIISCYLQDSYKLN
nr:hypothetical protein [uncultured Flavobacterium sp.]